MEAAVGAVSCQSGCFSKVFDFVLSLIRRKHNKPNLKVPGSIRDTAGNVGMNREAVKRCFWQRLGRVALLYSCFVVIVGE